MNLNSCLVLKIFLYFIVFTTFCKVYPQEHVAYINNERGLSSNLVKSIAQDDQGYIWIAADAGLVRYDGKSFVNYRKGFPSLLVKDVKYVSPGKLFVVTDLGIGYLIRKSLDYVFLPVAFSGNQESDTSLYYAKSAYVDSKGKIWVGDLTGVISVRNNKIKKYKFEKKFHVNSIFRSFSFAEDDKGNLIAAARPGYFFVYNKASDNFILLNRNSFPSINTVDALINTRDGDLIAGTNNGVYKIILSNDNPKIILKKLVSVPNVSALCEDSKDNIYIGTWENGLFIGKYKDGSIILDKSPKPDINSVKNLFYDRDQNVWACTDAGIALINKPYFNRLAGEKSSSTSNSLYTQEIHTGKSKNVYYTDSNILYKAESRGDIISRVKLFNPGSSNIQSFAVGKGGIWISYMDNSIEYRDKSSMKLLYSNRNMNEVFYALYVDKNDRLWAYLQKSRRVVRIDNSYNLKFYNFNYPDLININLFQESPKGILYCAGTGHNSFLFEYNAAADSFENISPKFFENNYSAPIQVNDFYIRDNGVVLLATNYGLYNNENNVLIPDNLGGEIVNTIAKAILVDNNNRTWIGTENGIYVQDNKSVVEFGRKAGLPNSSIVNNGLALDASGRLWVGTASGVVYWAGKNLKFSKSYKPVLSDIIVNEKHDDNDNKQDEVYFTGTTLSFVYNSLNFLSEQTFYSYRLIGLDTTWSNASTVNLLNFYSLPAGSYILEIKAKSSGHLWSNIAENKFQIIPRWYASSFMAFIYFLTGVLLIIFTTRGIYKSRIKKLSEREALLQRLVEERTEDLSKAKLKAEYLLTESEKAKEILEKTNEQKSQLLSIAAHDLKNPLQAVIGFSSIIKEESNEAQSKEMADIILNSSQSMISQIDDMLESVAMESKNLKLNFAPVDLNDLLRDVIKRNTNRAWQKNQIIKTDFDNNIRTIADEHWLSVAVDNLISNAIKYSPYGKSIQITSSTGDGYTRIMVKDQGVGLTEADRKKLFNRYQRLSAKPTGGESSTGLGLSIVKDIVEKHKGRVWAEGNSGEGAVFIIQLPNSLTAGVSI